MSEWNDERERDGLGRDDGREGPLRDCLRHDKTFFLSLLCFNVTVSGMVGKSEHYAQF